VNPAAGCLPILVQIPIFFALYKVLSNTIEMRHAPFFGWIEDLSVKDPTSIFNLFGLLPYDVPSFMVIGIWPCLMLLAMIVQKNISPPPDDPIQARIIALMPWFMTYIMAGFAAGLVIYWTVNNILAILQQIIIMRSMGVPIHLFSKDADKAKLEKEIEDGPVVSPSLEILEEKAEHALHLDEGKEVTPPKGKKKKKK
jgi:YidC/Oxa1 family membrane protein insertase